MNTPDSTANNNQLVRYRLALPAMTDDASVVKAREVLQQHQLLVDRVAPGEAVVASATGAEPDWPVIKAALQAAGLAVAHTTTVDEG
ncbi:hypothetical protein LJ737_09210 [Hymenobacter sp. 15J16-1T3B]|uniref:hypothetical protein n=1 Tax=Hymenobacter sp. 15J16-1T3B TaxID=2886941 RepID=UPI001D106CC3|nr:hypothetical protein [Hymenobacter sp. 15J16-1T3B]MCC3157418.1 hypothetical protein [Hymenobacter sp. 15J16-1T3B]